MRKILNNNRFLILCLFTTFLLRLPSLFEPYWYGDEGISLAVGWAIKKGFLLYKDVVDNKPPLIYLLAALAGNVFWFRLIVLGFCFGSILVFEKLARILFLKHSLSTKLSLALFTFLLSLPRFEGHIANAEILQILPMLGAFYFALRAKNKENQNYYFISGFLFSLSTLLKIPGAFELGALIVFLVFFSKPKIFFRFGLELNFLFLGFVLPIIMVFAFFAAKGFLGEFIQIVFVQNINYLSSWKTGSHQVFLLQSGLVQRGFFAILLLFFGILFKRRFSSPFDLLIKTWFVFSLMAVGLSGRPYAHYLLQLLPSFCFLIGALIVSNKFSRFSSLVLFLLLLLYFHQTKFWVYPTISYYQNFFRFTTGKITRDEYFANFDRGVPLTYQVAQFVSSTTLPEDKVFVWADNPFIYPLAKRLPATRFVVAYHIIDYRQLKEVESALENRPPKLVIIDLQKELPSPKLEAFFLNNYFSVAHFKNYELLHLGNYERK